MPSRQSRCFSSVEPRLFARHGSSTGYFSYFNASSITFTNTETTTLVFNSSYSFGGALDHTTSAGFALTAKIGEVDGIAVAVALGVTDNSYQIGIKEKGGFATQDVSIENSASSWALAMIDSLALRGKWESPDPATYLNPQVGRRFLPDNVGYALVSSLTADVYLTFNVATHAAVGRSVVPNPDIPPDNNIITFQINSGYTKNGTLDGKVGLYTDPDYRQAGKVLIWNLLHAGFRKLLNRAVLGGFDRHKIAYICLLVSKHR